MRNIRIKIKNGFSILAVILVIVAVIVAIGVWALSGQSNTSSSGTASTDIAVSALMNDSASIKLSWDTLVINGVSAEKIIMVPGDTSNYNIYNSAVAGGIEQIPVNPKAIRDGATEPEGIWVLSKNMAVNANGAYDYVVMIGGIKDSVCKKINQQINNVDTSPIASSMSFGSSYVLGATKANPNTTTAVDLSSVGVTQQWSSGCIGSNGNPDSNLFYRVLKMN